ncbi:MAG: SH3 domain-containing protein [Butyrivibrio sp.]|nr:SH3 domain-containing protein [Butyrivibrio sp.]
MKKNSNYMIFMLLFYIIVAFFAFAFLSGDYSIFNRRHANVQAPMAETVVGNSNSASEKSEDVSNIAASESSEEVETEEADEEEATEEIEEEIEATEEDSASEESSADILEEDVEEDLEAEEDEAEVVYYAYDTNHTQNKLRVRDNPDLSANVLEKLNQKSSGYILEYGDDWCKVVTSNNTVGYCSTEFLDIRKVTEEEFPEEYRELVTTTTEDDVKEYTVG